MPEQSPILIAYDGTANADNAIAVAGELFPGATVEVVHVSDLLPRGDVLAASFGAAVPAVTETAIRQEHALAEEMTSAGVERAVKAGLAATGHAIGADGPIWTSIVRRIDEVQPRVVVMGTRGLTGLHSAVVGSVSHTVSVHSSRPVLVVPLREEPGEAA